MVLRKRGAAGRFQSMHVWLVLKPLLDLFGPRLANNILHSNSKLYKPAAGEIVSNIRSRDYIGVLQNTNQHLLLGRAKWWPVGEGLSCINGQ